MGSHRWRSYHGRQPARHRSDPHPAARGGGYRLVAAIASGIATIRSQRITVSGPSAADGTSK
jgi:hypothetical protein